MRFFKFVSCVGLIGACLPVYSATIITSGFDGHSGSLVLAGGADNISGPTSLTINDWTTDASVSSITGLTAISGGGGFTQVQNGGSDYGNANDVFINWNHNLTPAAAKGYSFDFTLSQSVEFTSLNVLSEHANANGGAQVYDSTLNFSIVGGTVNISGSSAQDSAGESFNSTLFVDGAGTVLGPGTYTVSVFQDDFDGGGAYAVYDGLTLTGEVIPEPGSLALLGLGVLCVLNRRRRG